MTFLEDGLVLSALGDDGLFTGDRNRGIVLLDVITLALVLQRMGVGDEILDPLNVLLYGDLAVPVGVNSAKEGLDECLPHSHAVQSSEGADEKVVKIVAIEHGVILFSQGIKGFETHLSTVVQEVFCLNQARDTKSRRLSYFLPMLGSILKTVLRMLPMVKSELTSSSSVRSFLRSSSSRTLLS